MYRTIENATSVYEEYLVRNKKTNHMQKLTLEA